MKLFITLTIIFFSSFAIAEIEMGTFELEGNPGYILKISENYIDVYQNGNHTDSIFYNQDGKTLIGTSDNKHFLLLYYVDKYTIYSSAGKFHYVGYRPVP